MQPLKSFAAIGVRSLFDDEEVTPDNTDSSKPPKRKLARWVIYTLVGIGIGVGVTTTTICWRVLRRPIQVVDSKPKGPIYDQAWERKLRADIAALGTEIQAAKEAYVRQEEFSKSRTFSREDDRKEAARLNQAVLDLQKAQAALAAELEAHRQ